MIGIKSFLQLKNSFMGEFETLSSGQSKSDDSVEKIKKVAIELSALKNLADGIGEFSYRLASHIACRAADIRNDYGIEFYFLVPKSMEGKFGGEVNYVAFGKFSQKLLMRFFPFRPDLFHALHQYSRLKNMPFAKANLMTVHDINFIYEKQGYKLYRYTEKFKKRILRCDRLSFISHFVADDVDRNFEVQNHPRFIIYNAATNLTEMPTADIAGQALPENYLFHLSSIQPKKNVHLLIEMMRFLPEENLVLAGNWKGGYAEHLNRAIIEHGLSKRIKIVGKVTDGQKAALYAGCKAFLFPSLCEGFGLPPVEAMYFGKPVFLSTLTSLPEIGGDAAYYWKELCPENMALYLKCKKEEFYQSEENAAKIRRHARRYTWEKCADAYISRYLEILGY